MSHLDFKTDPSSIALQLIWLERRCRVVLELLTGGKDLSFRGLFHDYKTTRRHKTHTKRRKYKAVSMLFTEANDHNFTGLFHVSHLRHKTEVTAAAIVMIISES